MTSTAMAAARLLREYAEELKRSHTIFSSGAWPEGESEAKAAYEQHIAIASALEAMPAKCLYQIQEPTGNHSEIPSSSEMPNNCAVAAPAAVAVPDEREALQDGEWYWIEKEGWHGNPPTIAPALYKAECDAWYSFAFAGIPTRQLKVLEPCLLQARAALAATPAEPRHEAAVILEAIAQEPPINGNEIAKARTLMAARALRAATQAAVPAIPKWIDDPHDIEQGQMLNPEWVKLQEAATPADHSEQDLKMVKAAPVVLPEPVGAIAWNRDGERPTFHAGCTNKELLRLKLNEGLTGGPYRTEFAFTEPQLRALLATGGQAQAVEQEPFGYFKAEPFGWTDCGPDDEGAVALYERPQAQADARDADDADLIEWLSGQYLAADFHWGEPKTPVLVIEIPATASVCGDFRTDVRAAIAIAAAKGE